MASAPNFKWELALKAGTSLALFNTESFHDCMMGWWNHSRWEPSAGYQKTGVILHYDTMNLTTVQVESLTCNGGRPAPGKSIGRRMEEFDTGMFGPRKVHPSCLKASPCGGRTWQGITCPESKFGGDFAAYGGCFCPGSCPAGYYCGSDQGSFEIPGLEDVPGGQIYIYGIRGSDYWTA
mmetsp:Transcript_9021/g.22549  ORF Transcript_9021/g.22549 Transcript_9021/m.22549 type:complete len:179 (-) Transcript_9021:115-651(-)